MNTYTGTGKGKTGLSPLSLAATAAAAKSLQSCPTLCDPIDGSPIPSKVSHSVRALNIGLCACKALVVY